MTGREMLREALKKQLQQPGSLYIGEAAGCFGISKGFTENILTTPLSEEATVGLAAGLALAGRYPMVELLDANGPVRAFQALSEAVATGSRSEGAFRAAMLILCPLPEDIPSLPEGVMVWVAASPGELPALLQAARQQSGPVLLFYPSTLLDEEGDLLELQPQLQVEQGSVPCTILSWGTGVEAARLAATGATLVTLRSLQPLDRKGIGDAVRQTGRVVVAGKGSSALQTALQEAFLSLESPPLQVEANPQAIAQAVQQSIHY